MHTLPLSLFAIVALLLPTTLQAQIRPGNTARTTVGGARTTGGAVSGARGSAGPRQYRSNTELGDAVIQIDQETRSLVIVTDESTHGELIKVIESLDRPKPQVLIKVVFLEVTYNNSLDLGVEASYTGNWGYGTGAVTGSRDETITETGTTRSGGVRDVVTSTSTDLSAAAILPNGISAENLFNLANATQGAFIRVLADDWTATVHALSTKGKVEVLSRPSIMARNNQEAVIVVGQEVPFITNSRITDNGQTINTVQYDNVGIILRVTPFITSDGAVEMIVAPEISTLTDQTVPISNTASSPIIAKRSAETVVVTPNGRTVVIGGLMETQRIESIRKVPWLGDIPLLGAAFRRTVRSDVKKELMIFLTPHIVSNNETLHKLSEYEMSRTDLIERAYNEDDFNKYLDGPSLFPTHVQEKIDGVPVARATAVKGLPASRATPPPKPRAPASTPAPRQGGAPRPTNPKSLQR